MKAMQLIFVGLLMLFVTMIGTIEMANPDNHHVNKTRREINDFEPESYVWYFLYTKRADQRI